MDLTTTALVLSWVAIVALAAAFAGLLKRQHDLEVRLGLAPTATVGPDAPLPPDPALMPDDRPLLVVFTSPGCQGCERLVPRLDEVSDTLEVRVVAEPDVDPGTYDAVGVTATPFLVVVDEQGRARWRGPGGSIDRVHDVLRTSGVLDRTGAGS